MTTPPTALQHSLMEIAFLGAFYGLTHHARSIFDYARDQGADSQVRRLGGVGRVLSLVAERRFEEALQEFEARGVSPAEFALSSGAESFAHEADVLEAALCAYAMRQCKIGHAQSLIEKLSALGASGPLGRFVEHVRVM